MLAVIAALACALAFFLLLLVPALAHDEARWIEEGLFMAQHGGSCCGPHDCKPLVKDVDYVVTRNGYALRTGDVVPHGMVVHRAPDDRLWVCRYATGQIKPGCVFDAPGSF